MPEAKDLEPSMFGPSIKSVGYLGDTIPTGEVPDGFIDALQQVQRWSQCIGSMGFHVCPHCQNARSSREYISSRYMWPEMLTHYVVEHSYKPPDEFIEFVMTATEESVAMQDIEEITFPPFEF